MTPGRRRPWRAIGYTLMGLAGVAAIAWPAPAVAQATGPTSGLLVYAWAALLALGGGCAAVGSALDRWLGEYAGLWPLIATFAVYGLAALSRGVWTSVAGGCALLSISLLLLGRWSDVALIRREAARYHAEHGDR